MLLLAVDFYSSSKPCKHSDGLVNLLVAVGFLETHVLLDCLVFHVHVYVYMLFPRQLRMQH